MSKIPVGATIAQAYRFAFGDFLKILSIIWIPWLILSVAGILLRGPVIAMMQGITTRNAAGIGSSLLLLIPFYLCALYLLFMQITGITQEALGLRRGSRYYYLAFDKPVWRLIGAFILGALVVVGLYLALILAGVVLGMVVGFASKLLNFGRGMAGLAMLTGVIVFIVGYCAYIYILMRLSFLLCPVVIAESRIDFRRSWSLGKGNFWRMLAILLAVLVPGIILMLAIMYFTYGGFMPLLPAHATADQLAAHQEAVAQWAAAAMNRNLKYWYLFYPAYGVVTVLMYGLGCGAQSFAYRALVPEQAPSASLP